MQPPELEQEIKQLLIDGLGLEDLLACDIASTDPLFGDGLGLDSLDALELSVLLHERYGMRVAVDAGAMQSHLSCVRMLAAFVDAMRTR